MLLLTMGVAFAQEEEVEFAGTDDPKQEFEEPEAALSVEVGGTYTTGNAVYYTINGAASGSYKWDRNKLGVKGIANLGEAIADGDGDGFLSEAERDAGLVQNAKRYEGEGRYDRFLADRDSLYVLAGALHDPFGGYDLRTHEQVGYSRLLVDTEDTKLTGEIGADYAQEDYVEGVDPNYQDIISARLMLGLSHKFNENVSFSDTVEVFENAIDPEDVRVLNDASLTTTLSDVLSFKLSHKLTFDNVPVEGFQPLDQSTMVTLVASIL